MFGRRKGATYKVAGGQSNLQQETRRGSLGEGEVLGVFKRTGSLAQNDAPALSLLQIRNTNHRNKNKEHRPLSCYVGGTNYLDEKGGSDDEMGVRKNAVGNTLRADMKELSASFTDLRFFKPRKSEGDIKLPKLVQNAVLRAKSEEASPSPDDELDYSFIHQIKSKIRRNSHIKEEDVIEDIFGFLQHVDEDKKPEEPGSLNETYTRTGYLFFLDHKGHGKPWQKSYCRYDRVNSLFCMIPYHQTTGRIQNAETFKIISCRRKYSGSQANCFCFDIICDDSNCRTFKAESEEDLLGWVLAMSFSEYSLQFVGLIISVLEERGLEDIGIYRTCGVKSKFYKIFKCAIERQDIQSLHLENEETKTLTSVLKEYCRHFPGSLLTDQLKTRFIDAAKLPQLEQRIDKIGDLLHELPAHNQAIINLIFSHLRKVANMSEINKMTSFNLSTVWGPNLLSSGDETEDLLHIKDNNELAHILIENWEKYEESYPWQKTVIPPPSSPETSYQPPTSTPYSYHPSFSPPSSYPPPSPPMTSYPSIPSYPPSSSPPWSPSAPSSPSSCEEAVEGSSPQTSPSLNHS